MWLRARGEHTGRHFFDAWLITRHDSTCADAPLVAGLSLLCMDGKMGRGSSSGDA